MASLSDALAGRWSGWDGLDPGLTETDVDGAVGPARSEGRSWARLSGQQVQARVWERDQAPRVVRAWFDGIGPGVVLVELVHPPSDLAVDELVDRWGPPDQVGTPRRLIEGRRSELVWWRRGAAVTVCDQPTPCLVQVFERTDAQGWVVRLGGNDREGPSPSPPPGR